MQRLLIPALMAAALAAGAWALWLRTGTSSPPVRSSATATPSATETPSAPSSARSHDGFRLAGTAVGDPISYAAIESPDGSSQLYRSEESVPGLGRLVHIATDHAVILGAGGVELTLPLAPAATPTPDRRRLRNAATVAPLTPTAAARGGTPRESVSSDAPDRPAS